MKKFGFVFAIALTAYCVCSWTGLLPIPATAASGYGIDEVSARN